MKKIEEICATFNHFMDNYEVGAYGCFMNILQLLPHIKIREGYELNYFFCGDRWGGIFKAYCCKADAEKEYIPTIEKDNWETDKSNWFIKIINNLIGKKEKKEILLTPYDNSLKIKRQLNWQESDNIPGPLPYFDVPFTQEGIIEAWLLDNISYFLPKIWHSNYLERDFVFNAELFKINLTKYLQNNKETLDKISNIDFSTLLPQIYMDDNSSVLTYAYWNKWEGLVKAKCNVTIENNLIKFSKPVETTIIKYRCSIRF